MAHMFDLGLSDDEDPSPAVRQPFRSNTKKEGGESVADLLAGSKKDSLMFGGGRQPKRASTMSSFSIGGGGDPLDMLKSDLSKSTVGRGGGRKQPQEPEMDDEELEFQRQLQRELGMAGFEDPGLPAPGSGLPSRRQTPTPQPSRSPPLESNPSEDIDDIMGDILDDRPAARRPSQPTARRASPAPARSPSEASPAGGFRDEYGDAGGDGGGRVGRRQTTPSPREDWQQPDESDGERFGRRSTAPGQQFGGLGRSQTPDPFDEDDYMSGVTQPRGGGRRSRGPTSTAGASEREGSYAPSDRSAGGSAAGFGGGGFGANEGGRFPDSANFGTEDSFQVGATSFGAASEGRVGGRRKLARPPPAPEPDGEEIYGLLEGNQPRLGVGRSASPGPGPAAQFGASGAPSRSSTPGLAASGMDADDSPRRGFGGGLPPSGRGGRSASPAPGGMGSSAGSLFGQDDSGVAPAGGGPLEVELAVKPKKRLGMGKAKAQPSPTPPPSTVIPEQQEAPPPMVEPPKPVSPVAAPPPAPAPVSDDDDASCDLGDLLCDNTAPKIPATSQTPPAAAASAPQDGSDEDLPAFMRGAREPRLKRGEQSRSTTPQASTPPATTPQAVPSRSATPQAVPSATTSPGPAKPISRAAADLGFDMDDMGGSGSQDKIADSSASGSNLLEVPFEPKVKRKLGRPSTPGGDAGSAGQASPAAQPSQAGSVGRPSPAGSMAQQSSVPAAAATPHGAVLGTPSSAHGVTPAAGSIPSARGAGSVQGHFQIPTPGGRVSPRVTPYASAALGVPQAAHPASSVHSPAHSAQMYSDHRVGVPSAPGVSPVGSAGVGITGVPPANIIYSGVPSLPPEYAGGALGVPSATPSGLGVGVPGLPPGTPSLAHGVPAATLGPVSEHGAAFQSYPTGYSVQHGLPPGSPLTATPLPSDGGSLYARVQHPDPAAHPLGHAHAGATAPAGFSGQALFQGSPMQSDHRKTAGADGAPGTPTSEPVLSLFGGGDAGLGAEFGGRTVGNFSAFPPLAAAPQADLLSKLAYSEAKVRQMELQLEDCELRWQQRLTDQKQSSDAENERMEMQCRRLEAELDRGKDIHSGDIRHLNETKQMLLQNFEMEKDSARRDERRKMQLDVDKARADHALEIEELRRKHERALMIAQQQSEIEAVSLRRAHTDEQQLSRLVEQVQNSVSQVDKMSKRVEGDKSMEWSVRERQLEAREKTVRDMESRLSAQSKEVEDQRKRVSDLVRHMEDSQKDDRDALVVERERLESEHRRLLELQQGIRDADRNNKEALKHAWAQLEEEKRTLQQDMLKNQGDVNARKEEVELQERRVRIEVDRLKDVHGQVETARQNASRRIRETETTIASERRSLMHDLEVFEEKRRIFAAEVQKLDVERRALQEERAGFEGEVTSVGNMAAEVQKRSGDLKALKDQTDEAKTEIQTLRGQLDEERTAQGTEFDRLKTMQTLVEQQRLQLLQTENQIREQRIDEIMVTSQAIMPADAFNSNLGAYGYSAMNDVYGGDAIIPGGFPLGIAEAGPEAGYGRGQQAAMDLDLRKQAAAYSNSLLAPAGGIQLGATPMSRLSAKGGANAGGEAAVNKMRLQTVLRRSREESSNMHVFIQEQYRFMQQEVRPSSIVENAAAAFSAGQAPMYRQDFASARQPGIGFTPGLGPPLALGGMPSAMAMGGFTTGDSSSGESHPLEPFERLDGLDYRSTTSENSSRIN